MTQGNPKCGSALPTPLNLPKPDDDQKEAYCSKARRRLVLAGPGTGKTTLLLLIAVHLLNQGDGRDILFLCFSRSVAKEMKKRMGAYPRFIAMTLNAFCYRLIRRYYERLGYKGKQQIVHRRKERKLVLDEFDAHFKNADAADKKHLQRLVAKAFREGIGADVYLRQNPDELPGCRTEQELSQLENELRLFMRRVLKAKRKTAQISFDDQVTEALSLLELEPGILKMIGNSLQAVLVDEMQDLKSAQAEVVCKLAGAVDKFVGVGDDAQNIYSFGGNAANTFAGIAERLPYAKTFRLDSCHRCSERIANLANDLRDEIEGVRQLTLRSHKQGPRPVLINCGSPDEMDDRVVAEIQELLGRHGLRHGDIGILARTQLSLARIGRALHKAGIPYALKSAEDVLEICGCLQELTRILQGQTENIRPFMEKLGYEVGDAEIKAFNDRKKLPGSPLNYLLDVIKETGKFGDVETRLKLVRKAACHLMDNRLKARIRHHMDIIGHLSMGCRTLAEVDQVIEKYKAGAGDRVILATLHGSKGLEYESVIIVDAVDEIFPHWSAIADPKKMAAELRLLYVGVTRAKRTLSVYRRPYSKFNPSTKKVEEITAFSPIAKKHLKRFNVKPGKAALP
jgi:superfamily I DNA/RNA helicase